MGIQNKDGALYFATGIDNSGLYSGRQEAMGIIKAMASEITAFDVFGGIGISAGIAFARAAKGAYDFEKQFQQSMKEVATLSFRWLRHVRQIRSDRELWLLRLLQRG